MVDLRVGPIISARPVYKPWRSFDWTSSDNSSRGTAGSVISRVLASFIHGVAKAATVLINSLTRTFFWIATQMLIGSDISLRLVVRIGKMIAILFAGCLEAGLDAIADLLRIISLSMLTFLLPAACSALVIGSVIKTSTSISSYISMKHADGMLSSAAIGMMSFVALLIVGAWAVSPSGRIRRWWESKVGTSDPLEIFARESAKTFGWIAHCVSNYMQASVPTFFAYYLLNLLLFDALGSFFGIGPYRFGLPAASTVALVAIFTVWFAWFRNRTKKVA